MPMTEIAPLPPIYTEGSVVASSPERKVKLAGISLKIFISSCKLPEASFTATIFSKSLAKRSIVSAVSDTPVRPGTL